MVHGVFGMDAGARAQDGGPHGWLFSEHHGDGDGFPLDRLGDEV